MNSLFCSIGKIQAEILNDNSASMRILVDQNISDYYYKLIPKYKNPQRQKYKAHTTIIRAHKEFIDLSKHNLELFYGFHNKNIEFYYNNIIKESDYYLWLDVYSVEAERIRNLFNLNTRGNFISEFKEFQQIFHITIANKKNR